LRFPLELKHDLNEVNKADVAVFHRLGSTARENYFFDLGGTSVEFSSVLDALFNEVLLAIGEHFADHFPCDLDKTVLNEMEGDVHVVLIDSRFEGHLIKCEPIE
jgi:hypothetical protein